MALGSPELLEGSDKFGSKLKKGAKAEGVQKWVGGWQVKPTMWSLLKTALPGNIQGAQLNYR